MEDALTDKGKKPIMEYSIWKDLGVNRNTIGQIESSHTSSGYFDSDTPQRRPTSANPLVFHLLGDIDIPQSMVLTEKDYIDFAIYLSKMGDRYTLPHSIRQNLSNSTLLFVGYRLEDIRFIIVFEGFIKLMSSLQSKSIAVQVQLPSKIESESQKKIIQEYLEKFTESYFKIDIYWGDSESFFQQLRNRLTKGGQ
jgi:SIR2-like domain